MFPDTAYYFHSHSP